MNRTALVLSVVVIALSAGGAVAQPPPWAGGPPPIGQLYGYSPLVHSVDPFPSRTTGYAPSMFGPNGGKRIYPPSLAYRTPVLPYPTAPLAAVPAEPVVLGPTVTGSVEVVPVLRTEPTRGWRRFRR